MRCRLFFIGKDEDAVLFSREETEGMLTATRDGVCVRIMGMRLQD
jgi:hypothetical protein